MAKLLGYPSRQRVHRTDPTRRGIVSPDIATLIEPFDGSVINTGLWTVVNGSITVAGGLATLPTISSYSVLNSVATYSLLGSQVYAEIPRMPTAPASSESYFLVQSVDATWNLMFFVTTGSLFMRRRMAGVNSDTSITYNAVSHRFLRLREASNTSFFETSPDNVTWSVQRSVDSTGMPLGNVQVQFQSGYWDVGSPTDSMQVAGLNVTTSQVAASAENLMFF